MKVRSFLGLMILILVFMSACSGSGDDEASGNSDGGDGDKIELSFWNIWTEPSPQNDASLARVEQFMEENPDIVINQQNIAHDQFKVKVKTQAAGKQLPDLVQAFPGAELKPLVDGELVQPIDGILDHWDGLIPEGQLGDYQIDGKQYALPANVTPTSLVYYDKDMLSEVGYDEFPQTYDEFKELVKELKGNDTIPITLGNKAQWVLQSSYISTIADRMTGDDFLTQVLDTGEKKFTDEKFVESVGVIQELAEMEAFNEDLNSIDNIQHRDLFILGEAAMMIDGAWSLGPTLEAAPDKNIGMALFPEIEGGEGDPDAVSAVTGTGIALNSELEGEKLEAAEKFLKFFYSEDYYKELMKADILVAADIEAPDDVSPLLKEVSELTSENIVPVYDAKLPTDVTDTINSGLQEITLGTMTPEELGEQLQEAVDKQK
ncbi:extracellular solute-binding protein [Halobacillus seohaensis]|uniref:Extracellular solute-binding protein n=1 Tax=Halobacillus seohaensis TaxID=447421 RepID=A0ABW2EPP6_9BACI